MDEGLTQSVRKKLVHSHGNLCTFLCGTFLDPWIACIEDAAQVAVQRPSGQIKGIR
jgi:hypothetical protein